MKLREMAGTSWALIGLAVQHRFDRQAMIDAMELERAQVRLKMVCAGDDLGRAERRIQQMVDVGWSPLGATKQVLQQAMRGDL